MILDLDIFQLGWELRKNSWKHKTGRNAARVFQ